LTKKVELLNMEVTGSECDLTALELEFLHALYVSEFETSSSFITVCFFYYTSQRLAKRWKWRVL